jgi:hypothetical protein
MFGTWKGGRRNLIATGAQDPSVPGEELEGHSAQILSGELGRTCPIGQKVVVTGEAI